MTNSKRSNYLKGKFTNFLNNFNEIKDKLNSEVVINNNKFEIQYNYYIVKPKPKNK